MIHQGGCHCGAVRYEVEGAPEHVALCHCTDCHKSAGAPLVAWSAFPIGSFRITKGEPVTFQSSAETSRTFCGRCGTGLWSVNEQMLPGIVDVQAATLDDPEAFPAQVHIQVAERIGWMKDAHSLPEFERYPGG